MDNRLKADAQEEKAKQEIKIAKKKAKPKTKNTRVVEIANFVPPHTNSKNKTQNETMVDNISLIGNEIDNIKSQIKSYDSEHSNSKDKAEIVAEYLETHIQELTTSRAKLLYNNNDNEQKERVQKKKSFFKIFKKNTVKNTRKQIINKQYYYRLLLETDFIIKILKEIANLNNKIDMLYDFIKDKENTNKKLIEQNISIIDNEIEKFNSLPDKSISFINTSKDSIISYLSQLNNDMTSNKQHITKEQYNRLVLEHTFIAKVITDINDFAVKKQVLLDFIKFIKNADKHKNNMNNRKYNYNINYFNKQIQEIETKYIKQMENNIKTKENKETQIKTIEKNISIIDKEIEDMKLEKGKLNSNNYKTINYY